MQAHAITPGAKARQTAKTSPILMPDRLLILLTGLLVFFPQLNPGRITSVINHNLSLFTTALSYSAVTDGMKLALRRNQITPETIYVLMVGAIIILLGIVLAAAGACMSLGNNRMKRVATVMAAVGGVAIGAGLGVIYYSYQSIVALASDKIPAMMPAGFAVFAAAAVLIAVLSVLSRLTLPREVEEKMEMDEKYRLFLMFLPVLLLTFVFCYLPIYGWRFAFFDYQPDGSMGEFMGLYWFQLWLGKANLSDMIRVLRNTLAMSGLGIATSWFPVAFAILLAEVKSSKFQRFVQTFTTIPNFISWVLVYSIALSIFSTDGFMNSFLRNVMGVDGANRFHCIWHITVPGLMPTYCVMLLMSVAGILSNGMEQYLVFSNAINSDVIQVLDLYVYQMFKSGSTELSIVVDMAKSLIGVVLLFAANGISKVVRGESII